MQNELPKKGVFVKHPTVHARFASPFLLICSYSYFVKFFAPNSLVLIGIFLSVMSVWHSYFDSILISIESSAASGSIYAFSKLCSYSRLVHVPFMFVQWNKSCAESILSISHQLVEY